MIKILIYLLLIYIGYKFLKNILLPLLRFRNQFKSFQKQAEQQFRQQQGQQQTYGDVKINYTPEEPKSAPKNKPADEGEYIEYEEVK
jgi:hypothetical protein